MYNIFKIKHLSFRVSINQEYLQGEKKFTLIHIPSINTLENILYFQGQRDNVLAVCYTSGDIDLVHGYDDVSPVHITTGFQVH